MEQTKLNNIGAAKFKG